MFHDMKETMVGKTIVDVKKHGDVVNVCLSDGTMIEFSASFAFGNDQPELCVCQVVTEDEIKLLK